MTATVAPPQLEPDAEAPPPPEPRTLPRWAWGLIVIGAWLLIWLFTKG
jgi:hypothetical protein